MKPVFPLVLAVVLAGCQVSKPADTIGYSNAPSSAISDASGTSLSQETWETYSDPVLDIRIDHPSHYRLEPSYISSTRTFSGSNTEVTQEGIYLGEGPEANGIMLYRIRDPRIISQLTESGPFTGKKTVNETVYDRFELGTFAREYGYVTKKGDWYYVFQSTWGPDNPISEKMLQSLVFE